MLRRFYPKIFVKSIYKINYNKLLEMGYDTLLFDLDNTIVPFDIPTPSEEIIDFFKELTNKGFKICIVSNNNANRVNLFNESLQQQVLPKAGKPKLAGIKKAMKLCNGKINTTAIIGDQLFTDVWVGNRIGLLTILVSPIAHKDEFTVKLKRGLEKIVFNQYLKTKDKNRNKSITHKTKSKRG